MFPDAYADPRRCAAVIPRAPMFTRAFVACTGCTGAGALGDAVDAVAATSRTCSRTAAARASCSAHRGHFLGRVRSHPARLRAGRRAVHPRRRLPDRVPGHLGAAYAYAAAGRHASFRGPGPAELSMLAQLARVTAGRR